MGSTPFKFICLSTCSSWEAAEEVDDENAESFQFEFETIRAATNNFADANKLGQGGFGAVYRVSKKFNINYFM